MPPGAERTLRGRARIVGILTAALLAGGVGGAGAAAAAALLHHDPAPAQEPAPTVVHDDTAAPGWTAVATAAAEAVVAIQVAGRDGSQSQGSGVVISADGDIVTNNHVVASGADARITAVLGETSYEAEVVGTDPPTDLAVIRLLAPPQEIVVPPFGDDAALRVGEPVMAIGNPLGLSDTVTTGIVSALHRPVTTRAVTTRAGAADDDLVVTAAIQTSAAINPGNSGGALLNSSGEVVGITSSIASVASSEQTSGNIGIGFAIGANQVRHVADQLVTTGTAEHPRIGVSADDVTGTGRLGARVATVADGSPAQRAGLVSGDLITAVDEIPVTSVEQLVALVRAGRVDTEMTLTLMRNGSEENVTLTPAAAST